MPLAAQQPGRAQAPPVPPGRPTPPQAVPLQIDLSTRDANETRERLRDVLNQYPPSVREVLRIDTSLLSRPDYLETYPVLAAFLEQHPEVAHNPAFFIGESRIQEQMRNDPRSEAFRTMERLGENFMVLFIVITITSGIVFLLKTLADQLRTQRAYRTQAALNTKLIDRFASSEELLAYLQSPVGKGLTEMPGLPASAPRTISAPLNRIFWSVQAGIVLAALGIGIIIVSGRFNEIGQFIFAQGSVILALGIGFVASAAAALLLSKRLGLVNGRPNGYSRETLSS